MSSYFAKRIVLAAVALWLGLAGSMAVSQTLGALARVDLARSTIEDSGFAGVTLRLGLTQGVPFRVFTLDGPERLVVDFREVDWTGVTEGALKATDRIEAIRFGGFRPGWSRLVVDLGAPLAVEQVAMRVNEADGTALLEVGLGRVGQKAFAAASGMPPETGWDGATGPAVQAPERAAQSGRLVVMIDPGHGGIDPGAQNGDATEAQLMLVMARELQETLRRAGGFDVRLTRDGDDFVSLEARVAAAHHAGADLFISLHADALDEGVAHGATVYTLAEEASDAASAALAERHNRADVLAGVDLTGADDEITQVLLDLARLDNTPRSQALARFLVEKIENAVGNIHKRPLRQAGFSVLKAADIPSVLIELGFLSTNTDLRNLRDPIWRSSMAAGIRDGIQAWAIEDEALARLRRQ